MNKWLPAPLLSLFLLIFWLLLQNKASVGLIVLGALLAWLIPLYTHRGSDFRAPIRRPLRALQYFFIVLGDIVVANFSIAAIILRPSRQVSPAWIEFPLSLKGELPITVLACTVSLTPGTISTEISEDQRTLLIHALNVDDEQLLIRTIQQRYEQRLKEIFGC